MLRANRVPSSASADADRRAFAEQRAFRYLEERWKGELKGRKIPKQHRQKMRKDPHFQRLVDMVASGAGISGPDLDHTPVIERQLDGSVVNHFEEEMAGDPRGYFCPRCGGEKEEAGKEVCPDCEKFLKEFY